MIEKAKPNVLVDKSYQLALEIVKFVKRVQSEEKEYILTKQLIRSGTAVGALVAEAQQAESKADFIHKLAIANKEAYESNYWLRLMKDSGIGESDQLFSLCQENQRLLVSIIKSARANK